MIYRDLQGAIGTYRGTNKQLTTSNKQRTTNNDNNNNNKGPMRTYRNLQFQVSRALFLLRVVCCLLFGVCWLLFVVWCLFVVVVRWRLLLFIASYSMCASVGGNKQNVHCFLLLTSPALYGVVSKMLYFYVYQL